jgi:hypothetical protein
MYFLELEFFGPQGKSGKRFALVHGGAQNMPKCHWTLFLWPGLPRLWLRGSWFSLFVAVAAAAALSAALVLSFGWSELMEPGTRTALWGCLGVVWCLAGAVAFARRGRLLQAYASAPRNDPFPEALSGYLRGDWFQTERVLAKILEYNERDIEARLLLATMLRRLERFDEAERHLNLLVRLDGAEKWELEIGRERERIAEGKKKVIECEETAQHV